jgi:magnesium-transporting ATPase (P-type)
MMLGLSLSAFTTLHVIISLVAIAAGLVVFYQMLNSQFSPPLTLLFLAMTILTSVTGFTFPIAAFTPAIGFGIVSLVALALSVYALYSRHLAGAWRWIYVATALFALYLNVFVLVVQAFQKIPTLNALAPNGSEPPFAVAQVVVLLAFLYFGYRAVKTFRTRGG